LAKWCEDNGYLGIMAEGWDKYLGWRSPNYLYRPSGCKKIKVLLKNYKLSDDVAFRFGNKDWNNWPLNADTYANWIHSHHGNGETVNLFMDYESFGEHQWEDTGIFNFLRALPEMILRHPDTSFKTATETVQSYETVGEYDVPEVLTWADTDRDLTAWVGNDIQRDAIASVYRMEEDVMKTKKKDLIETWRKLQTSDHFYYMCTKWSNDGDVHAYFSPYQSPYDAYIAFMNALSDLQLRVSHAVAERESKELSQMISNEEFVDLPEQTHLEQDQQITEEKEEKEIKQPIPVSLSKQWWEKVNKMYRSLKDLITRK
jgi:alpha-amylase